MKPNATINRTIYTLMLSLAFVILGTSVALREAASAEKEKMSWIRVGENKKHFVDESGHRW